MNTLVHEPRTTPREIHDPMLRIDLDKEMELLCLEDRWAESGHNAKALLKHDELRIVLVALRAGVKIGEHDTDASVALTMMKGSVRVLVPGGEIVLAKGQILAMRREISHQIEALEDSTLLLTIGRRTPHLIA